MAYLPHHGLGLPEPGDVGEDGDAHGREDVEQDSLCAPVAAALVVVREADGEEPLDGHSHHHVDGGAQCDAVERVLEPGERLQQYVGVEPREGVAESLQHPEDDVKAVADDEGCVSHEKKKKQSSSKPTWFLNLLFPVV